MLELLWITPLYSKLATCPCLASQSREMRLALLMNTPSLQHVGNVLEPFSRLQVCFLALATCIARLMGVGNVHGAFPGVGNLNGASPWWLWRCQLGLQVGNLQCFISLHLGLKFPSDLSFHSLPHYGLLYIVGKLLMSASQRNWNHANWILVVQDIHP